MATSALFTIFRPTQDRIRRFLAGQSEAPFSYGSAGLLSGPAPAGFSVDCNGTELGSGEAIYRAACEAVRRWEMFRTGWTTLCTDDDRPRPGNVVGILVHRFGVWSLNACRVISVAETGTEGEPPRRFEVIYGTLPGHCECGEERFLVEWRADDTVHFEIRAYSRPAHLLTRALRPMMRQFQKQFARGALAAMQHAVAETNATPLAVAASR